MPPVGSPTVAVIVLSWNRIEDVLGCLVCVEQLDYPSIEMIVVDNGSRDDSVERIGARFPQARLIVSSTNLGYAGGVNLGLRAAEQSSADFAWLLNDDVRIEVDTLSLLMAHAAAHPQTGLLSPIVALDKTWNDLQFAGAWVDWDALIVKESRQRSVGPTWYSDASREVVLTGAAMLLRMSVNRSIGSFDERFFAYYEDTDFSIRAVRAGFACAVVTEVSVVHRSHRDAETRPPLFFYYMMRNELLFFRKHRPGGLRIGGLRRWLMTVLEWTAGCRDRQQPENVRACVDGAWDALRRRYGPMSGRHAPRWFHRLIAGHPYLMLMVMRGEIGTLSRRLLRRSEV
jgi:GT2 family glycosyltransferase